MNIKKYIQRNIYNLVYKLLTEAAKDNKASIVIRKLLNYLIISYPKDGLSYKANRLVIELAQVLHAGFSGTWICRGHEFGRILGEGKAISFIFPYYRKKDEIANAIKSLKSQEFKNLSLKDIQIIVIDDGSTELIDDLLDDDVIYVRRNKFGYGISRSRNLGAKISSGRVLCFVDPDFEFPKNYIETLYSEYLHYGPRTIISGFIHDYFYSGCEDPRVAFGVWEKPDRKTNRFLQLAGGHMVISRDLFFRVGGFDEDLIYGEVEDTYFGYLLSKEPDLSIVFSSKLTVKHIPHPVGLAHSEPLESFRVSAFKSPEFYRSYVLDGER